jgi:hypothetical protein
MAKVLSSASIQEGAIVEASHVSQSVKAFTGTEDYDIKISGSLTITGSTNILGTASATYFAGNGSQLTSIDTGSWDGVFSGSAEITGSLNLPNTPITASAVSTSTTIFSGHDLTATRRLNSPVIRNGGSTVGVDGGLNSTGSIIGNADLTIATVTASSHISSSGGNLIGNKLQADDYFQGPETTERINLSVAGRGDYIIGGQTVVRMETAKMTVNKATSFLSTITSSGNVNFTSDLIVGTSGSNNDLHLSGSLKQDFGRVSFGTEHLIVSGFSASPQNISTNARYIFVTSTGTVLGTGSQAHVGLTTAMAGPPGTTYEFIAQSSSGNADIRFQMPALFSGTQMINGKAVSSNHIITMVSSSGTDSPLNAWMKFVYMGGVTCSVFSNQTLSY